MASVTFPPAIGGDGSTVSDDTSPTTGLANGGHRTRFIPAFQQLVAICINTISQLTTLLGNATTQASNALTSADNAAASAASALSAPGTNATSTTSMTLGLGAKTLTVQTGKSIVAGSAIMIADASNPAVNYAHGIVTSYVSGTGVLGFTADYFTGSGTLANWVVSLTAPLDPSRAALNSPVFVGNPTAPTPAAGDRSQSLATTAFVAVNQSPFVFYSMGVI